MSAFLSAILGSVIPSLFGGGGQKQTPGMAPSVGAFQPSAAVQQPPVTDDGNFLQSAGKLMGNEMLSAFGSKITAGMRGSATLRYNQKAFPGTNPWEHLGGGARGQELAQLAGQQSQMKQAERASIRQSQTQLGQSRMAATSALAGQIYQNNGNASLALISRILKNSGVLTEAGRDYQEGALGDTHLQSQIGSLRAQTNLSRVQAELAPYLAVSGRISAGGNISKEAKGLVNLWNSRENKRGISFGDFLKSMGDGPARTEKTPKDNVLRFDMNP